MWSSMLDSVASGKKLPEKNLIILGKCFPLQKVSVILKEFRRDS